MAQEDYIVQNGTGLAVRTKINNVNQAVLSGNSGNSSPVTTVAGMIWNDTSVSGQITVKQRNANNSGWTDKYIIYSNGTMKDFSMVGSVIAVAGASVPVGFLECDGSTISSSLYPDLYSIIGATYGGDSANFMLPDLRGEFIRGWDNGRGVDADRALGTNQADEFRSHNHTHIRVRSGSVGMSTGGYLDDHAPYSSTTGSTGGSETRPRNVAMMYCIKY